MKMQKQAMKCKKNINSVVQLDNDNKGIHPFKNMNHDITLKPCWPIKRLKKKKGYYWLLPACTPKSRGKISGFTGF